MDRKIILATAGSGKTYYIANDFLADSSVLLISFTNGNVENIRKEIRIRFDGIIPDNIMILTFDSFVYNFLLRPFEPIMKFKNFESRGVEVKANPVTDTQDWRYQKKDNPYHFLTQSGKYYVSRMSKLFMEHNSEFKKKTLRRIERYFDAIYFDEFQDYTCFDYKVMDYILKNIKVNAFAVGDIFQSGVTPIRHKGVKDASWPFNKIESIKDLCNITHKKIEIDSTVLLNTRRVSENICKLIRDNMNIEIYSQSESTGKYFFIEDETQIDSLMNNEKVVKLIWNMANQQKYGKNFVNWSYSKGDTYDDTCVILTGKTDKLEKWSDIDSVSTRNKLYVALTRSKGNLYLVNMKDFKKWKVSQENNR